MSLRIRLHNQIRRGKWWTRSWSPVTGCTSVSEGCRNCWARVLHEKRYKANWQGMPRPDQYAFPFSQIQCHIDRLDNPLTWTSAEVVAVCPGGDLFHEDVPDRFIDSAMATMWTCSERRIGHRFIMLTKRWHRLFTYFDRPVIELRRRWAIAARMIGGKLAARCSPAHARGEHALPNFWPGVSVEDQHTYDERTRALRLLKWPGAVVSAEPLLTPVRLTSTQAEWCTWIVAGGESGPKSLAIRATPPDAVWSLADQCHENGIPFFFKQWGAWQPDFENLERPKLMASQMGQVEPAHGELPEFYWPVKRGKRGPGCVRGRLWLQYPESIVEGKR